MIVWCVDSPGFGGAELNLIRVLKMTWPLPAVVLHSEQASPLLLALLEEKGIRAEPVFRGKNTVGSILSSIGIARALLRKYKGASFVVWCHHIDSSRWMQFTLALYKRRFAIVEQVIPDNWAVFDNSRLSQPLKSFATKRAYTVVLNAHCSKFEYCRFFETPNANVRVIPNTRAIGDIADRAVMLAPERSVSRKLYGIPVDAFVIVCVGRLHSQKNQATLLAAYQLLYESHKNVALLLVGDGDDREKLEQIVSNERLSNIHFLGFQSDPLPYLAMSDVFVLPSLYEGLSGALLEAVAFGIPCIVSNVPNNLEVISDKVNGIVFPPLDSNALFQNLDFARTYPSVMSSMAKTARSIAFERFDEKFEADGWLALVNDLSLAV